MIKGNSTCVPPHYLKALPSAKALSRLELAMAKREWQTRWKDRLKEKLIKFDMSNDRRRLDRWLEKAGISVKFKRLQDYTEFDLDNDEEITKALSLEKCPYSPESKKALLWQWRKWRSTEDCGRFMDECIRAGEKYGFRWQTIFEALFLPQDEVRIESFTKPQWYLEPVFSYTDEKTMSRLGGEMPLGTSIRWHSEPTMESDDGLVDFETYESYNIFRVVLEFPLDYPREGILEMAREAAKAARSLCEALGRRIKERQKSKPILLDAKRLRLGQRLLSGEVYQIIDEIYGEDLMEDQERRKRIISRRHKGKKHLSDR